MTASVKGADSVISIHAPRAGSDLPIGQPLHWLFPDFNPRSPCGERQAECARQSYINRFQSTLPVRGATSCRREHEIPLPISIHAPRAGSDQTYERYGAKGINFNPRSPCGERLCRPRLHRVVKEFQSTLPVRGATAGCVEIASIKKISIHAPRAGSDRLSNRSERARRRFQSTLPVRGATKAAKATELDELISIHAPRAGSDENSIEIDGKRYLFQSTLPVRGATQRK